MKKAEKQNSTQKRQESEMAEQKIVKERFGEEEIEVIYSKSSCFPDENHPGVKRETILLKAGSVHGERAVPLTSDILFEKDVPVRLRDGVVIFADVFRPAGDGAVPAIIAYSPYGKHVHSLHLPWGVPDEILSNLQKQEGPDPGFWVPQGYAVVQPDARGTFYCYGDNRSFGTAEAKDGYDIVEWAAAQPWCSGKVAMAGNSYLAVSQFLTASLRPPHLAAIAPWEGFTDFYRHTNLNGGIPNFGFQKRVDAEKEGFTWYENTAAMAEKYPCMNAYWEDKRTKLENIDVPAYIVASYVSKFHTYGTLEAFGAIASKEKWLRVHNTHEWPDLYEYQPDLKKFFDRFLKGEENGWEKTPRVRLSVLDTTGEDIVNRLETDFPLPDTEYRNLYLDSDGHTLSDALPAKEAKEKYCADDRKDFLEFTFTFEEPAETTGYFGAHLWVETEASDDLDLFVYALKADETDALRPIIVHGAPSSGFEGLKLYSPCGRLRASFRELDEEKSTQAKPFHTFRVRKKLTPGVPVRVDIPLWPAGIKYKKGEKLKLIISGYEWNKEEWPDLKPAQTVNKGNAFVYTGGDKASYLTAPFIPKR